MKNLSSLRHGVTAALSAFLEMKRERKEKLLSVE